MHRFMLPVLDYGRAEPGRTSCSAAVPVVGRPLVQLLLGQVTMDRIVVETVDDDA